jgi:hypothetical protein
MFDGSRRRARVAGGRDCATIRASCRAARRSLDTVVASDASRQQLHPRHRTRGSATGGPRGIASVRERWADTVTVAQALHWLDS